jgi:hypothetical protein
MEALSGVLMLPVVILLLGLFVLAILLPYYVYATASRTLKLLNETQEQAKAIKAIQKDMAAASQHLQSLQAQGAWAATQAETQNNLLRQLLRTYGHEPEV